MAVEGGHHDAIGPGQIGPQGGSRRPDQGTSGRIEFNQPLQPAGQAQVPLESPCPRGALLQIRVAEEAGEVRQDPLGLAAHLNPHETGGGAPIKFRRLIQDLNPAQLGAADSPGQRRRNRSIGSSPHGDLQTQVHRQGDHRRLTHARSCTGLQQAGIAQELEAHLLQQGQIVARIAAADLKPPALNLDLATIGQLQAGRA